MKRLDRRTFSLMVSVGGAGAILTACGNDPDDVDLNPTLIPVEGAPPTLAPNATPGGSAGEEEPEPETGASAGGEGGGTTAVVDAFDLGFTQKELTIAADTDVTITYNNTGVLEHDLIVEDTDFGTDLIAGGESVDLVVNLPEGEYTYYCSVAGHREAGMEGTLHVVAGGGGEAPAEEEAPAGEEGGAAGEGGAATTGEVIATDLAFDPKELTVAADTDAVTTDIGQLTITRFNELLESTEGGLAWYPDWPVAGLNDILVQNVTDLVQGNASPSQAVENITSAYDQGKADAGH